MAKLPQVSGKEAVRVLEKIGFIKIGQKGSHVKLSRIRDNHRQTVIVPMHRVIKPGTLRNGILKPISLAVEDFVKLF
jgi:predicted RNA binding protein YcfA (HicA-like mRNA interferase family)